MSWSSARRSFRWLVVSLLVWGATTWAVTAFAQPPGEQGEGKPVTKRSPAEEGYFVHMTNGVKLFNSNNFKSAIAEFEAAYKAVPKASPLINQALCYRELKNYPRAVERLELALAKHRASMTADDVTASERAIADMRALFAYVTITVAPASSSVTIDGDPVSPEALRKPVPLSPGEHEIGASAGGFLSSTKTLSVVSSDQVTVALELVPARGTLRVIASKPDSMIEIDGEEQTPGSWQGELPAGAHSVRAVGESGEGTIEVVAGQTVTIDLSKGSTALPPLPTTPADDDPKRGFYAHLNGAVLIPVRHPKVFSFDKDVSSGGYVGVRAGYRVHTYAAFEGMLEYGNVEGPANGAGSKTYSLSSIRIGPSLRLMSPGDLVHFVGTLGGGIEVHLMSYEDLEPDAGTPLCLGGATECESNGVDFYVQTEVGVEIDFDHVLIGVAAALYLSGTKGVEDNPLDEDNVRTTNVAKPYDNEVLPQLGPRLYIGYAFW